MSREASAAAAGEAEPCVKGTALRPLLEWYVSRNGRERLLEIVGALPPDLQGQFDVGDPALGLKTSIWYPARLVGALLDRMAVGYSPEDLAERAREGARTVMRATLRGVYRLLFDAMMSPERYVKYAHLLFSRYYNTGRLEKVAEGPTRHLTIVRDWSSHHPFLCQVMVYVAEVVYEEMGCANVRVERTACISQGSSVCSFVSEWSAPKR